MNTETRILPTDLQQIRAIEDGDQKRLFGYGVVFQSRSQDLGGFFEEVNPTAANRTLSLGNDFLVTMNHNVDLLLGRTAANTARVGADQTGVFYEVDLPDTSAGRDAWTLAQRGDLAGSSFTFTIPKGGEKWRREGDTRIREITEFRLIELGPVASPAYLDTTVAARSLTEHRAIEQADSEDEQTSGTPTLNIAQRRLLFAR